MDERMRVLLVSDAEMDCSQVAEHLADCRLADFELTVQSDPGAAIPTLKSQSYDVCVVEARLSGGSGAELIAQARQQIRPCPPMILLTDTHNPAADRQALEAGAANLLEKDALDAGRLGRMLVFAVARDREGKSHADCDHNLQRVSETLHDGLLLCDDDARVLFINPAAQAMLGYQAGDMLLPEHRFDTEPGRGEVDLLYADRSLVVQWQVTQTHWRGEAARLVTLQDLTAHRNTQRALRQSEERFALTAAGANDGLWDWELANDRVYFSPRWLDMVGYSEQDRTAPNTFNEWLGLLHPDDLAEFEETLRTHLDGGTAHLKFPYRIRHRDGGYRWMLCRGRSVVDAHGKPCRIAGSQTDITRQKSREQQSKYDAQHDRLTGLANQNLFFDILRASFSQRRRRQDPRFTLMVVDLDDFKVVNDSLGHAEGDRLLVKVARRINQSIRPCDIAARLGGDAFALLLAGTRDVDDAIRAVRRLQAALEQPFSLSGQEVFVAASIGIAMATDDHQQPGQLLRDADTALHRAKQAGKNGYAIFDEAMHDAAVSRLQMETRLRHALQGDQLGAFFQPIVSLDNLAVSGFEALARWHHPTHGLIQPGDFIDICEQTGMIVPLGIAVLREACRLRQEWRQLTDVSDDLYISVNLSPRQLADPQLLDITRSVIQQFELTPGQLCLEITESALIGNCKRAQRALQDFRDMGVRIYLDDFGTGYSSLSYLHDYPIDVLKIDQSFVARLQDDDQKAIPIIQAIVDLASALSIQVVAEGIETDHQLNILRRMGCGYGQGRLFSMPLSAAEVRQLLQAEMAS